ncbi:MAG: hypothetical protein HKO57_09520, partial [Akkermansiaceae bacterium]|nr:hypothetical protein [Akkermansiaceae bacterium]
VTEYARLANGALEVEFVDPVRDADRALEIADAYQHVFIEDVIIVDAVPAPPAPAAGDAPGEAQEPPGREEERNARIRFLPVEDMLVYRTDTRKQRRLVGYQAEDLLTSDLIAAVEGQPRRIYFLADKSQLQDGAENTPWSVLSGTLRRQNILLTPLRLSDTGRIPEDAEGVALIAPQYDLDEREEQILRDYWERPRSALLVVLDPVHRPARLRAFLREHGITPRDDRILTVRDGQTSSRVRATFAFGAQLNRITVDLAGKGTVLEGGTSSLEVREGAEDLLNRRIFPLALIEVAPGFWGESRYAEGDPEFDPAEDSGNPAPVAGQTTRLFPAAAVIRGNATDERTAGMTSRMVVIANTAFLHPDRLRPEQIDFLRNSANWLLGREELIGVGPRPIQNYKLNLLPRQISFVNRLNLFIIPGAFALLALFVWNARRA